MCVFINSSAVPFVTSILIDKFVWSEFLRTSKLCAANAHSSLFCSIYSAFEAFSAIK